MISEKNIDVRVQNCLEELCTISDISPLNYRFIFSKQGFLNIEKELDILPRTAHSLRVNFIAIPELEIISEKKVAVIAEEEKTEETIQEKIQSFREKKGKIFLLRSDNLGEIYITDAGDVFYNNKNIYSFDNPPLKKDISVLEISGTEKWFVLRNEKTGVFVLPEKNFVQTFSFVPEIDYIKFQEKYIFVTQKGSFFYDVRKNSFEYYAPFHDFISYEWKTLWLLRAEDEQRKKIFGFTEYMRDILVSYNPQTLEKEVIYESDFDIQKIFLKDEKIILEDNESTQYEITLP